MRCEHRLRLEGLFAVAFVVAALGADVAHGALVTKTVEYKSGDATCEGYLAYDDATAGQRPGVVVIHEWFGVGDHVKQSCDELARSGYVALAADIYGKGVRPKTNEEAGQLAGKYRGGDRALLRARVNAALDELRKQAQTDPTRLAAIGYCFGGTTALELARSGADVDGVVSFHGGLGTPNPTDAKQIKCAVLALHGADDPYVPAEEVRAFEQEMRDAGVDWQLVAYGGAVHSFTNPAAGDDPSKGAAYDARAARRGWLAMMEFLSEVLK